ncbi:MAG: type II toxin-antitoxin system RelE/ParE family toxin [Arcobacter sp.]|uniref:type II toxin-antitoxin system RelE/ParE family toxin n=1 Tax=Arcobacter sp. TaxID=1872629 RepID=UPI003C71ADFC
MPDKVITVLFYETDMGNKPVKEWLSSLNSQDKKTIGGDIKTVEYGWPIGMPTSKKLEKDLYEVRSNISDGKIARVIFTIKENYMVLLNGFIKKSQKTPLSEIKLARERKGKIL